MTDEALAARLRAARLERGLLQTQVARLSGLGVKSISSFESGARIASMHLDQLRKLLDVYGLTEAEFFGCDHLVHRDAQRLLEALDALPPALRCQAFAKIKIFLLRAAEVSSE